MINCHRIYLELLHELDGKIEEIISMNCYYCLNKGHFITGGLMLKIRYIYAKILKKLLHPIALNNCTIDKTVKICAKTELTNCSVEKNSYIGYQCFMVNTQIGKFCSIADRCSIGGGKHPMEFVSTSPVFHEGKNILKTNYSFHAIEDTPITVIENDVWIGQGVFIKAGVTIATGAVIGMGSVVTKDIPAYQVWAGNPAHKIRDRFNSEIKEQLLNSYWWEWNDNKLSNYAKYFNEPELFIKKIKRTK